MLSHEENAFLSRVGSATPAGQLLRRYWHVVGAAGELSAEKPKKRVKMDRMECDASIRDIAVIDP